MTGKRDQAAIRGHLGLGTKKGVTVHAALAIYSGYTLWVDWASGDWTAKIPPNAGLDGLAVVAGLVDAVEALRAPPCDADCE